MVSSKNYPEEQYDLLPIIKIDLPHEFLQQLDKTDYVRTSLKLDMLNKM